MPCLFYLDVKVKHLFPGQQEKKKEKKENGFHFDQIELIGSNNTCSLAMASNRHGLTDRQPEFVFRGLRGIYGSAEAALAVGRQDARSNSNSSHSSGSGTLRSCIAGTLRLVKEGATVPFIVRYRKEATGGLTETLVEKIFEFASDYLTLEKKQKTVLAKLEEQVVQAQTHNRKASNAGKARKGGSGNANESSTSASGVPVPALVPTSRVLQQIRNAWSVQEVTSLAAPYLTTTKATSLAASAVQRGLGPVADKIWGKLDR